MFWKRHKKTRRQRQYTNYNWVIVGLVIIVILNYYDGNRVLTRATDGETVTASGTTKQIDLKSLRIPSTGEIKVFSQRLFPDPSKRIVTIQDLDGGEGAPAVCGQDVAVIYQAYNEEGDMLPDSKDSETPLRFTIGQHQVMPAFEQGVIGMRPGGVRNIFSPPKLAYGAEGFANDKISTEDNIRLEVRLIEASPALPAPEDSSFHFFDIKRGLGHAHRCGESLPVHITVWNTEGEKIYTSYDVGKKEILVTPGSGEQFLGLEHAVIDMRPGMARTAIVPPAFQKVWHQSDATLPIKFPENQTVLVDIQAVHDK